MTKKTEGPLIAFIKWRKSKGQWGFRLVAQNGETVHSSEKYTRKATMMEIINRWNEDTLKLPVPVIECNTRWKPIETDN